MIRAKPLIWIEPSAENNWVHMAKVPWGTYYVHICGGRHMGWLEAFHKPYERECGEYVGSVVEAQMQCEAHADALVADMAQPVTPEEAARLLKLCDDMDELNTTMPDENGHKWRHSDLMDQTIAQVRTAIRAIATPPQEKDDA